MDHISKHGIYLLFALNNYDIKMFGWSKNNWVFGGGGASYEGESVPFRLNCLYLLVYCLAIEMYSDIKIYVFIQKPPNVHVAGYRMENTVINSHKVMIK